MQFSPEHSSQPTPASASGAETRSSLVPLRVSLVAKGAKAAQRGREGCLDAICKVCGQSGHAAGFVGAVYLDCPVFACYLCKQSGHTTMTCPHRIPASLSNVHSGNSVGASARVLDALRNMPRSPSGVKPWSSPLRMALERQRGLGSVVSAVGASSVAAALIPCPYTWSPFRPCGIAANSFENVSPWQVSAILQVRGPTAADFSHPLGLLSSMTASMLLPAIAESPLEANHSTRIPPVAPVCFAACCR